MDLISGKMYLNIVGILLVYFNVIKVGVNGGGSVTDVTSPIGLNNVDGVMAVFCDFDSDRDTDILVIRTTGDFDFNGLN